MAAPLDHYKNDPSLLQSDSHRHVHLPICLGLTRLAPNIVANPLTAYAAIIDAVCNVISFIYLGWRSHASSEDPEKNMLFRRIPIVLVVDVVSLIVNTVMNVVSPHLKPADPGISEHRAARPADEQSAPVSRGILSW